MERKNLCAMIPADLHAKVREKQELSGETLSNYIEKVLTKYYEMEGKTMSTQATRTLAIQISSELMDRVKIHLTKNKISQKDFLIGLIEKALDEATTTTTEENDSEQG